MIAISQVRVCNIKFPIARIGMVMPSRNGILNISRISSQSCFEDFLLTI